MTNSTLERRRRRIPRGLTTGVLIAAVGVSGCTFETSEDTSRSERQSTPEAIHGKRSALRALGSLAIKGRAPKTGYDRDEFGSDWATVDGCSERERILRRDLVHIVIDKAGCKILTGVLHDPYTRKDIHFVRGIGTSSEVQIDHVVALGDAWQKGAQQMSDEERRQLANDPLELLAVDGSANESKGDGDAATWLPSNKSFRCDYVARQVAVKRKYELWVTQAEHDSMERILETCPNETLPN